MKRTIAVTIIVCVLLTLVLGVMAGCAKNSHLPEEKVEKPADGVGKSMMPTEAEKAAKRDAARAKGLDPDELRGSSEKAIPSAPPTEEPAEGGDGG